MNRRLSLLLTMPLLGLLAACGGESQEAQLREQLAEAKAQAEQARQAQAEAESAAQAAQADGGALDDFYGSAEGEGSDDGTMPEDIAPEIDVPSDDGDAA